MNTRRSHIVLFMAGFILLAGAGCTVEVPEKETQETVITFDPVMYATSKVGGVGEYPQELPFGVSAWEYNAGETWFGEKATPFLVNSRVCEQGSVWVPDVEVLWPGRRQQLAFVAYAPFGAADYIDPVNGVTFASVDVSADQSDLLYTDPAAGLTVSSSGGVVSLAFRHALCSVSFTMRSSDDDVYENVSVLDLTLDNVGCVGTFRSLPTPGWNTEGKKGTMNFFEGKQLLGSASEPVGKSMWVIPQFSYSRAVVRILRENRFSGNKEETLTSSPLGIPLEPGRNYTFSLTCSAETGTLSLDLLDNLL